MQPPKPALPRMPSCLALILAQSVSLDVQTGTVTIATPYWRVIPESYPIEYLTMEFYVVLTECAGDVLVELRLVDMRDSRPPSSAICCRRISTSHLM